MVLFSRLLKVVLCCSGLLLLCYIGLFFKVLLVFFSPYLYTIEWGENFARSDEHQAAQAQSSLCSHSVFPRLSWHLLSGLPLNVDEQSPPGVSLGDSTGPAPTINSCIMSCTDNLILHRPFYAPQTYRACVCLCVSNLYWTRTLHDVLKRQESHIIPLYWCFVSPCLT